MEPPPDVEWLPTWMGSSDDVDRVGSVLRTLVAQTLKAVRYQTPRGLSSSEHHALIGVDQIGMGVEILTIEGAIFVLSWRMQGYREGLGLAIGSVERFHRADNLEVIDATTSEVWNDNVGRRINSVAWSWFEGSSDESAASEAIWSVRLGFDGGHSVAVALGEVPYGTDEITYIPDNLVAISDRVLAEHYFLVDGPDSAWGTGLDSGRGC